jgi:5-methylcytosine-specific restriction protein A
MPFKTPTHSPSGPRVRAIDDAFYSLARWRKVRLIFLGQNPFCADPFGDHKKEGRQYVEANNVDHIVPRRDRPDLAYDKSNLQSLCHSCHSRKTIGGE